MTEPNLHPVEEGAAVTASNGPSLAGARRGGLRARGFLVKSMRLATYLMVVGLVIGGIGVRKAIGEGKQLAMSLGEDLAQLASDGRIAPFTKLRINGQPVQISSATTDLDYQVVLNRFEADCNAHADGMNAAFANLTAALAAPATPSGSPGVGTFKQIRQSTGVVVCFAEGGPVDNAALLARLSKFAKSGDLGDLGALRYVTATKTPAGKTHVIGVWTDGSFNVKEAFPTTGDAPGTDVETTVRPRDARRTLSAAAEGAPYGVRNYVTRHTVSEVLAQFDADLPLSGWKAIPQISEGVSDARAFSKGGIDLLVSARRAGDDTDVSIVSMGR
jgi:hypothetical protein